jgi:hypothetical protein
MNEKNTLFLMRTSLRLVLLAEKVNAFLPSKNFEVFIFLSLLSKKYFQLHLSLELSYLRTNGLFFRNYCDLDLLTPPHLYGDWNILRSPMSCMISRLRASANRPVVSFQSKDLKTNRLRLIESCFAVQVQHIVSGLRLLLVSWLAPFSFWPAVCLLSVIWSKSTETSD